MSNLNRRLTVLESARLESEIVEIRRYFASLTEDQLTLIIAIEDTRRAGESLDKFTRAELDEYERVAGEVAKFSEAAMAENNRRCLAELEGVQ